MNSAVAAAAAEIRRSDFMIVAAENCNEQGLNVTGKWD
jgi:hypothetical protein